MTDALEEKRRGRRPKDQKRIPVSLRVTPTLHSRLVAMSDESGRSLTQEVEFLLERALEERRQMATALSLGMDIGSALAFTLLAVSKDAMRLNRWQPDRHEQPVCAMGEVLHALTARGVPYHRSVEEAKLAFPELARSLAHLEKEKAKIEELAKIETSKPCPVKPAKLRSRSSRR
jgi:hypothetical protein